MTFAAATDEKAMAYLGFPLDGTSVSLVGQALSTVEAISDTTTKNNAIARVEGWLTQLDTIQGQINTERDTEGSTLLPELRREGRRHVQMVANALSLDVRIDIFGTSGT
ncbi:hypothetical protein [Leptothoe sp. PORK10 BA2]|uniref:hypothetical protein n=1 Tax=Leptothoe sp. PORK10 BA2 TaxID=3110254 RepID=UPI002B2105AF|nr:hypothetical protein [Leptothoe sp. PORK10 BA2]MEA5465274.1 hypothetical protein [Leptothoe sp. PORK10 BA2]